MAKNKDTKYNKVVKFTDDKSEYVLQLKKPRNWWWLLLLLIPLLLLVRCEHDLTVTCLDERSDNPLPGIEVAVNYDSHFLYKDGAFFVCEQHDTLGITNEEGKVVLRDIETSVYSLVFHFLSKVTATADGLVTVEKLLHFTRHITIYFENVDCDVDIVMCIDNTGSMSKLQSMVKNNALNFCDDLTQYCSNHHRNVKTIRIKVIAFGDLEEKAFNISDMFIVPDDKNAFKEFVNEITAEGGGDGPENSLEAIASALQTDWVKSDNRLRHIVVVYTDAPASELDNPSKHTEFYPTDMPKNIDELKKRWKSMNPNARKMIIFAPSDQSPWSEIEEWPDVYLEKNDLKDVLSGTGYEKVLEAICKSL